MPEAVDFDVGGTPVDGESPLACRGASSPSKRAAPADAAPAAPRTIVENIEQIVRIEEAATKRRGAGERSGALLQLDAVRRDQEARGRVDLACRLQALGEARPERGRRRRALPEPMLQTLPRDQHRAFRLDPRQAGREPGVSVERRRRPRELQDGTAIQGDRPALQAAEEALR